ncbi:MAG TPA: methyl-accepting chemotaxis protein [Rhodopseudomonas sp.]|uniref:methyl-accepting chemotaxis protein n=1 Tax=Rhodopseudomonas sp. TaxID=1078 RepID=UPI002ED820E1
MLARLSIRAKITTVVAFLLLAMTGIGLLAVSNMRAINATAVEIQTKWMPSVRILGDLRGGLFTYRNMVREHMLSETAQSKAATEQRLSKLMEQIAEIRRDYEKLLTTPAERAIYQEWATMWANFEKGNEEVMALSRKAVGQVPHDAHELSYNVVNPIGLASDAVLKKSIDYNNSGAAAASLAAAATYDTVFRLLAILLGLAMLTGVGISIYLVRDVDRGIGSILRPMQALGDGDLSAEVPHQGEHNEIGAMADRLQMFKQALIAKKEADAAAAVEADVKIQRGQRVDAITREFETIIGEIIDTVSSASTELEASAGTLTATAERAQRLTSNVATASDEAATNVQSVSSATEQMSSSVNEINRQVQESARIAGDAVEQARKTNDSVSQLSHAASRIGDVVELINTIAGQTNLLALNATIEAARAGDAGRGFAVVAAEVKALAEQTGKATGEISLQINGIQTATQQSVGAIQEIGLTIGRMSQIAATIASAVEQQGAATQEISRNVHRAAEGTQQVSSNITDVQRGASETGSASSQVLSAARSLSQDSNRLKVEVDKFLSTVRAA